MYLRRKNKGTPRRAGFSLVELLVSVGITAVLMVGISAFFTSTFRGMFEAREKVSNSQGQFVVGSIMQQKFAETEELQTIGLGGAFAVLRNSMDEGDLPFTYIGTKGVENLARVVFRDFFIFNGLVGSEASALTGLVNPGGITKIGPFYYVTVPQENAIYKCDPIGQCDENPIPTATTLNMPMGITNDGADLYVTEAGSNTVVKITLLGEIYAVSEVVNGLNFPTGIEFYSAASGDYLFVSDTYNHVVKKIALIVDGTTEIIVGDGEDEDCTNTARYCKLNYPTGLVVGDDGDGEALYIADTGNSRVLKLSDPDPDLTNYLFEATISGPTQVSQVDFVFPEMAGPMSEGLGGNNLHTGRYDYSGSTISYYLNAPIDESYTELVCAGPDPCVTTKYFRGFDIAKDNNLFEDNDDIEIDGDSYTIVNIYELDPSTDRIEVTPNTNVEDYPDEEIVTLVTDTFTGDKEFYLDISGLSISSGFNVIDVEVYDEAPALNNDPINQTSIRIGDGELGTIEDTIALESAYDYPTGLGWDNAFPPELVVSGTAVYDNIFPSFDYTSDFWVIPEDFLFTEKNGGDILELEFTAKLAEDAEGNPIFETVTLSADLSP